MSWFLFVFSQLRWEVTVCFVDIGKIVDHQRLNFLFIMITITYNNDTHSAVSFFLFHKICSITASTWNGNQSFVYIRCRCKIWENIMWKYLYECVMYYRGSKRENMKCYLPFEVNGSKLFPTNALSLSVLTT